LSIGGGAVSTHWFRVPASDHDSGPRLTAVSSLAPPSVAPPGFSVGKPWRAPVTTGAVALAGTAVLAVGNPNTTHVPLCPLRAVTGLDCPLCGSLRAVHSLTRADLGAALDHNLLFTVSVPALVVCWVVWLSRSLGRPIGADRPLPRLAKPALLAIALVFAVVRNLPAFAWLGSGA